MRSVNRGNNMQVSTKHSNRHSENEFTHRLRILSDAGAGIIHIRTQEVVRAYNATRQAVLMGGHEYREWDVVNGLIEYDLKTMGKSDLKGEGEGIDDVIPTLVEELANKERDKYLYFSFVNPQHWLEGNPPLTHFLERYSDSLPPSRIRILLITPDMPLPDEVNDLVVTLPFDTPSHSELVGYLGNVVEGVEGWEDDEGSVSLSDKDYNDICHVGAGLSKASFEMYSALSIVDAASNMDGGVIRADDIVKGINQGKTEIINKNDILELYQPEDMKDVGGMDNLKDWVAKRANCYSDEAQKFGIEAPRGLVFVGVSGTGKSLAAKAIAKEFGVPLIRLDFGRIFNSFVGKSESRMRTALDMVCAMSPCILLCDEIDKGLGGIGSGGGDSGTSSRVLGAFLTWLQENKSPVFTVVTANNINGLPPELLRRGRFDAIFGAGLPTDEERLEVLNIHLTKRGYKPSKFSMKHRQSVVRKSKGYVPAEIESAVKDGLIDAFSAGDKFTMEHVYDALENMVPLSKTYAKQIQTMTTWIKGNAMPVSKSYEGVGDDDNTAKIGKRRTRVSKDKA